MTIREGSAVHIHGGSNSYDERETRCVGRWATGMCLCGTMRKTGFFVHGFGDGDVDFFSIVKVCADFLADFPLRKFDIVLRGTFAGHQIKKPLVNVDLLINTPHNQEEKHQLVFSATDIGNVHVVSGGTEIFVFPLSEDLIRQSHGNYGRESYINSNQMDFRVAVLAGFGGTHIDNLLHQSQSTDSPANHDIFPREKLPYKDDL